MGANAGIEYEWRLDVEPSLAITVSRILIHLPPKCAGNNWWLDADCVGLLAHELTHMLGFLGCFSDCLSRINPDSDSAENEWDECEKDCRAAWDGHNEPGETRATQVQHLVRDLHQILFSGTAHPPANRLQSRRHTHVPPA